LRSERPLCVLVRRRLGIYSARVFAPTFIHHRGQRILRLDFSHLEPAWLVVAAGHVRRMVTAEPLGSVRTLTVIFADLTSNSAAAIKHCALADKPHIRASAMVGSDAWRRVAADVRAHGREELTIFENEVSALDWLARQ
jgi:hypothetical protein